MISLEPGEPLENYYYMFLYNINCCYWSLSTGHQHTTARIKATRNAIGLHRRRTHGRHQDRQDAAGYSSHLERGGPPRGHHWWSEAGPLGRGRGRKCRPGSLYLLIASTIEWHRRAEWSTKLIKVCSLLSASYNTDSKRDEPSISNVAYIYS